MTVLPPHIRDLLARAWLGEASLDDQQEIERWLADAPRYRSLVSTLRDMNATMVHEDPMRVAAAKNAIGRAIADEHVGKGSARSMKFLARHDRMKSHVTRVVYRISAAFVCLAFAIVFWQHAVSSQHSVTTRIYATSAGQRARIDLAGGTAITLAPSTTLMYDPSATATVVTVRGAARFAVAARSAIPFIVRTGTAEARVLGTIFVVRKYTTDHATLVMVTDGRVAIHPLLRSSVKTRKYETVVSPSTYGIVDDSGTVSVASASALAPIPDPTDGQLVFHNTPLRDVIADLSRAYDVTVRLADSTAGSYPFTTTVLVKTHTLDDVLEPLLATLGAHATRSGRIITIIPGRPASNRSGIRTEPLLTPKVQYGR